MDEICQERFSDEQTPGRDTQDNICRLVHLCDDRTTGPVRVKTQSISVKMSEDRAFLRVCQICIKDLHPSLVTHLLNIALVCGPVEKHFGFGSLSR